MSDRWFPGLRGQPEDVQTAFRIAYQHIYALDDRNRQMDQTAKPAAAAGLPQSQPIILAGLHSQRIVSPASPWLNAFFWETDRSALYAATAQGSAYVWTWLSGMMIDTSSTLAGLPGDLGPGDAGFIYRSSVFDRLWRWTGSGWTYADGSLGAGGIVATTGAAPSGGFWQTCNGSTVQCALSNATLSSLTATAPSSSLGFSWWMRR
jgi:hypothetical protein